MVVAVDSFWANDNHHVTVYNPKYDLKSFEIVDELDAAGEISAVAITADGKRIAIETVDHGIEVRTIDIKQTKYLLDDGHHSRDAIRFSPHGDRLFANLGLFECGDVDLTTSTLTASFSMGTWLSSIRYLTDSSVIATGSDGLVVYSPGGKMPHSPMAALDAGLDLTEDGGYFCAAGRDGNIACFSRKPAAKL